MNTWLLFGALLIQVSAIAVQLWSVTRSRDLNDQIHRRELKSHSDRRLSHVLANLDASSVPCDPRRTYVLTVSNTPDVDRSAIAGESMGSISTASSPHQPQQATHFVLTETELLSWESPKTKRSYWQWIPVSSGTARDLLADMETNTAEPPHKKTILSRSTERLRDLLAPGMRDNSRSEANPRR